MGAWLLLAALMLGLWAGVEPPAQDATPAWVVELDEGRPVPVAGTDLTLTVLKVWEAAPGCLGGPVGCSGRVRLRVARSGEIAEVLLALRPTPAQPQQELAQARRFGYRLMLTALHGTRVTLRVERN